MRRHIVFGLSAVIFVLLPACGVDTPAPAEEKSLETTRQAMSYEEMDARATLAAFDANLSANGIQGYCAAIVSDKVGLGAGVGSLVWCRGRLRPSGGTINGDTIFDFGSLTKLFVGELLADQVLRNNRCYEEKLIDRLHANGFVTFSGAPRTPASWPIEKGKITLEELATHTSGLQRNPLNPASPGTYSLDDLYDAFSNDPLDAAAGTAFEYSNFGFGLLAQALSTPNGFWFDKVKTHFLDKLGMDRTGFLSMTTAEKAAMAWASDDATTVGAPWQHWPANAGDGGMHSTANDMVKWMNLHLGRTSLNGYRPAAVGCAVNRGANPMPGPGSPMNLDKAVNEAWTDHSAVKNTGLGWNVEPGAWTTGHLGDTFVTKDGSVGGMGGTNTIFWAKTGFAVKDLPSDPRRGERSVGVTILAVASQADPNQANASGARDQLLVDLLDDLR